VKIVKTAQIRRYGADEDRETDPVRSRSMLTVVAAIATVSGLAASLLPLLQISKMIRERSGGGLSIPYLVGGSLNGVVWLTYSFMLGNLALILPNVVGFSMGGVLLATALVLRPSAGSAPAEQAEEAAVELPVLDERDWAEIQTLLDETGCHRTRTVRLAGILAEAT
jgi:uncharacterized protein with PQ loop repeat